MYYLHPSSVREYISTQEDVEFVSIECIACTIEFMTLRILLPTTMAELPKRSTDQSIVIHTSKYVTSVSLKQGPVKAIQR